MYNHELLSRPASAAYCSHRPLHAHKAPTPEPNDDPLPGEHPVPQEEPVPSPKPESQPPHQ